MGSKPPDRPLVTKSFLLLVLRPVVLYPPNLCCVMSGFASSVAGVAEAITPSLRHKAPSPPIRHPTGCLAEAGGRMHIVIDSIHC